MFYLKNKIVLMIGVTTRSNICYFWCVIMMLAMLEFARLSLACVLASKYIDKNEQNKTMLFRIKIIN